MSIPDVLPDYNVAVNKALSGSSRPQVKTALTALYPSDMGKATFKGKGKSTWTPDNIWIENDLTERQVFEAVNKLVHWVQKRWSAYRLNPRYNGLRDHRLLCRTAVQVETGKREIAKHAFAAILEDQVIKEYREGLLATPIGAHVRFSIENAILPYALPVSETDCEVDEGILPQWQFVDRLTAKTKAAETLHLPSPSKRATDAIQLDAVARDNKEIQRLVAIIERSYVVHQSREKQSPVDLGAFDIISALIDVRNCSALYRLNIFANTSE